MNATKALLVIGSVLGAVGVAAGAMGAHALRDRLSAAQLANWDSAARYLLFHALAIVAAGLWPNRSLCRAAAGIAMIGGCVLFSGCLAGYALTDVKTLALIVPVGGVSFIIGWLLLAGAALKSSSGPPDRTHTPPTSHY